VARRIEELSYLDLQTREDSTAGHAVRRYWKGHYVRELSAGAIEALLATEPGARAGLQAYGGAIADVPDGDSAFSQRDTRFEYVAATGWTDAAEDAARIAATRASAARVAPFASGVYVNVLGDDGAAGVGRAYPPQKLARLAAVKALYDPDNVFHLNQNISPAAATTPAR
jgi:FAD/FMN-containing dehydrogenase